MEAPYGTYFLYVISPHACLTRPSNNAASQRSCTRALAILAWSLASPSHLSEHPVNPAQTNSHITQSYLVISWSADFHGLHSHSYSIYASFSKRNTANVGTYYSQMKHTAIHPGQADSQITPAYLASSQSVDPPGIRGVASHTMLNWILTQAQPRLNVSAIIF